MDVVALRTERKLVRRCRLTDEITLTFFLRRIAGQVPSVNYRAGVIIAIRVPAVSAIEIVSLAGLSGPSTRAK